MPSQTALPKAWIVLVCFLLAAPTAAQPNEGTVQLPLSQYQSLTGGGGSERGDSGHAFSGVRTVVAVEDHDGHPRARVTVSATVRTFGEGWSLVPLPAAGPIEGARQGSTALELIDRGGQVAWAAPSAGSHAIEWTYAMDATRYEAAGIGGQSTGWSLGLQNPGAGGRLEVRFADQEVTPIVVPASTASTTRNGNDTVLTATVPSGPGVQISWSTDAAGSQTLSRARYTGEVVGESLRVRAELSVDIDGSGRVFVPLLPATVALQSVTVDRADAPIAVREDRFVVPVRGRGRHRIVLEFLVPIGRDEGLPHVDLHIARTPVSAFEVTLPGDREVQVEPGAGVTNTRRNGTTVARFNVPMTEHVRIHWSEAVPETDHEIETRSNANIVHVVQPGEGVLDVRAFVDFEISRGTMRRAELVVPAGVQINSVESASGVVNDWRVSTEGARTLTVFLDREVETALALEVKYELAWPAATRTTAPFDVPLLRAAVGTEGVHRQRGMVALLSMGELTLEPRESDNITGVGDNALPAAIRDVLEATVAHTYRYQDEAPELSAIGAIREAEAARFDAQVDTLVSLGDVSTTVATRIEVDVKSGSVTELLLHVPEGLSLLEVSAPSLRRYVMEEDRSLRIELTQPMEGRFTVELLSDRVTGQEDELDMPLIGVAGAEVERGRVGVEALAPFQVDMASAEHLSPIDPSELPEQLMLRTDNPILHAYRYAQATEAPRFRVRITRHEEVQTRQATVDEAWFETLYTRDGVAVTSARFVVRNRRQQFLRVTLPEDSEVWSAAVDGRPQTPALETGSDAPTVLLNIVSAADAFEVTMVYATETSPLGTLGRVDVELATLDIVAAQTTWSLVLPGGVSYAAPDSSLTPLHGVDMSAFASGRALLGERVAMPADGVRYVFRRMYATRAEAPASISVAYVSGAAGVAAHAASGLGALLFWLGLLAMAMLKFDIGLPGGMSALRFSLPGYRANEEGVARARRVRPWASAALVTLFGVLLCAFTLGYLAVPMGLATGVTIVIALAVVGVVVRNRLPAWRARVQDTLRATGATGPHPAPAGAPSPAGNGPEAAPHFDRAPFVVMTPVDSDPDPLPIADVEVDEEKKQD